MLVLSRKKDERIDIDGSITVTVVDIRGDKVRLGVDAPEAVAVHRREVSDAIRAEGGNPFPNLAVPAGWGVWVVGGEGPDVGWYAADMWPGAAIVFPTLEECENACTAIRGNGGPDCKPAAWFGRSAGGKGGGA